MAKDLFGSEPKKATDNVVPFPRPLRVEDIRSYKDVVDFFNKDHLTAYIKGKYKVVRENPDGTIDIMDVKDFVSGHKEFELKVTSEDGKDFKLKPFTEIWLGSNDRRKFKYGLDFDPPQVGNRNGKYNLFKGYKLGKGVAGDVAPFLGLMRDAMCAGDERDFTILEALTAQMFQEPNKKPGIVVVIRGEEGVGKSFFMERLCDLMEPYYFRTSKPEYVFGEHNSQLANKILLHLEEAVWPGGKKNESLLKDMITNPIIPINEKFVPVFSVPNHLHLFITGNPEWLIAAGPKARRLFALHASETHIKDTDYFSKLYEWFKNGGDAALLHHFLNFDFKTSLAKFGIKDLRLLPVTKEHIHQQKQSMSGVREWANNWVELGEWPYGKVVDGHVRVIKSLLYHDYINSPVGKRNSLTERQFGTQFLALFPLIIDGQKQYFDNGKTRSAIDPNQNEINFKEKQADAYDIPSIHELRSIMDFNFGGDGGWDEKKEWTIRHGDNKFDVDSKTIIHKYVNVDGKEPF
jgi:hypothetical protein